MPRSKPRGACLRNDSTRQRGALTKSSTGLTAEPRVANSQPLALRLYRLGCVLGSPLAPKVLARRLSRGKEHPKRLPERLGVTNIARPKGPLVWIHGASVGEMLAAVSLIERLRAQDFAVLVTSGTVTSAALAGAVRRIRFVAQSHLLLRGAQGSDDRHQWPLVGTLVRPMATRAAPHRGLAQLLRSVSYAVSSRCRALCQAWRAARERYWKSET